MYAALLLLLSSPIHAVQTTPPPFGISRCEVPETEQLGTVMIPRRVTADGKPLDAGQYVVALTKLLTSTPTGQSPAGACWVEFVLDDVVVGREIATVVPPEAIAAIAKGPLPKSGSARVDVLKEGEYLRIWFNHGGTHYIVNLPIDGIKGTDR